MKDIVEVKYIKSGDLIIAPGKFYYDVTYENRAKFLESSYIKSDYSYFYKCNDFLEMIKKENEINDEKEIVVVQIGTIKNGFLIPTNPEYINDCEISGYQMEESFTYTLKFISSQDIVKLYHEYFLEEIKNTDRQIHICSYKDYSTRHLIVQEVVDNNIKRLFFTSTQREDDKLFVREEELNKFLENMKKEVHINIHESTSEVNC